MSGRVPGDLVIASKFEQASWLLFEIAKRRDFWSVSRHPFQARWAAGELSADDLQCYASEYHHVVVALACQARRAAELSEGLLQEQLCRQAQLHEAQIELWCEFAQATGWCQTSAWYYAAEPLPETDAGVRVWVGDEQRPLANRLVTIHALHTAQSVHLPPQLDALCNHYGLRRSTQYFRERGAQDGEGLLEAALTGVLPVADPFALMRQAERTLRAYWELLDGVERNRQSCCDAG